MKLHTKNLIVNTILASIPTTVVYYLFDKNTAAIIFVIIFMGFNQYMILTENRDS